MYYELDKPDFTKINKEKIFDLIFSNPDWLSDAARKHLESPYLYWDKIKYKVLPKDIKVEEFWFIVKILRSSQSTKAVIKSEAGRQFGWVKLSGLDNYLNQLDLNTGGFIRTQKTLTDNNHKQAFISRGIIEEAIASSQLEGAHTTRKVAKKMILEGRKPRNKSEQMISNNYEAISKIEKIYKDVDLTLEIFLELHKLITKGTLENVSDEGGLRSDSDEIVITDEATGDVFHEPPKMAFVTEELKKFFEFANDKTNDEPFIHPIIKAIMLHFWVGYLHPFVDGNGRLARLVFYWYLLKKGYWAFSFLPISRMIKKSPKQYGMAYIYSEQDSNDLTYFIDYNLSKINQARKEFSEYVARKTIENSNMNKVARLKYKFNERQIMLLQYFYGDMDASTNTKVHTELHQITKKTAIKDLKQLAALKFLITKKIGAKVMYYPTENAMGLFNETK